MSSKGKIGIVGSGLIGQNWALIFVSSGYEVHLYDRTKELIDNAIKNAIETIELYHSKGVLRGPVNKDEQIKLIHPAYTLKDCLSDAIHCQECVFEDLNLKVEVFKQIDECINNDRTTIGSSTSCFLPSKFTENLKYKHNCLVSHPINPPYFVPLVEIVPAPWTSLDATQKVRNLLQQVGQKPINMTREIEGFAVNRIQYAILNEAFNLVKDEVISPEDIDSVMKDGLGMRYCFLGMFEVCHLNAKNFRDYGERFFQGAYNVSSTFKPIPKMHEGDTKDRIAESLEKRIPLDQIAAKSKWRDLKLMELAKLKKDAE